LKNLFEQSANSSILSAASYAGDLDALITVEVMFINPTDDDGERLQIANIQFNNLDIIGEHNLEILQSNLTSNSFHLQPTRRRLSSC
jgi:hypothetical protein